MTLPPPHASYIGDGVYVHSDGIGLVLQTSNGVSVQNQIVLEPEVLVSFLDYLKKISKDHTKPPSRRTFIEEVGECKICDNHRNQKIPFMPPHDAAENCESNKYSHCSCDICF